MRFLNPHRVLENVSLLSSYVLKTDNADIINSKQGFIDAINNIQRTSFANEPEAKIEFDNKSIPEFLLRQKVFHANEIANDSHIIPVSERPAIAQSVKDALSLIRQANPDLYELFNLLIGSVGVYSIPERDGGSISSGIGLIWLSPVPDWDTKYYGEMLFHEFVHNCVFLEDMTRSVMPDTDLLVTEDALSISAIRQTKRPFDKSFHSACVVTGIMYYYNQIGEHGKALEFLPSLRVTLSDLHNSYNKLAEKNQFVLSPNGLEILNEMESFSKELDFSVFEQYQTLVP